MTEAYLERAAVFYLGRYASTAENLRRVLLRKARRRLGPEAEDPPGLGAWIDAVVDRSMRSGLVDDRAFADGRVHALSRQGTSVRGMRQRLHGKGVPDETADAAIAAAAPDELDLARRHVERKRLGRFRTGPPEGMRDRDLASLCRAGFSFRIAARALDEIEREPDDGT